jgi:RNA polymerase sigma-70 factor (ECF subfamily)
VLDFYKKSQRSRVRFSQPMLERVAETAAEQAATLQLDARREALDGCLEKLRPADRELLARRFAEGATTASTAAEVGRSVDAVYKALAKIRQALFDCVTRTLAQEGQP